MPVTLHLKRSPNVPLEAEVLSPDVVATLSNSEIRGLTIYHGKRQLPVSEFFEVEGEHSDDLVLHGAMHKVRWVGRGMSRGSLTVHGAVGMHLGAYMSGGRIDVYGNAGDWVGAEMKNGFIHVHGNAGGQIGAAYRGAMSGMRNGVIIVDGSAGLEVGMRMRRGTIVVGGPARDFTGLQMKGGTIILLSGAEIRTGAWMKRGTIISMKPLQLMPTFQHASNCQPTFVDLYARHLRQFGVQLPSAADAGSYAMYRGDQSVPGKGEILVWSPD
ncbi:MAG: formylmethanofuran dehydrogenase subunit C [Planctomycetaceae bacterium]|nr:formylmethanofuran dehydrogenase subunit C [Planctomycetaceae bacterium]